MTAGLLGPTLHAEVGDTLVVHLKNMADKPVSIHPQGIAYSKNAEGSLYDDRTSSVEKRDDAVLPGQVYTYVWDITEEVGPREADLPCLTYAYYSHENMAMDFNSGLIGALLICKKGSLNEDGSQKLFDKEYVLMFGVFDEDKSWQKSASLKYTINGYTDGTLPAGMHGYLTIRDCGDKEVKKSSLSYKERRMVNSWEYFIAAEEVTWDYAPNIPDSLDRHYKAQHLDNFSNLIGKKYKKAIFRQYTDASFTKRLENPRPKETGILGPVIRAQLHDNVKVVFKNKASRPYSIYFHGVTLSKNAEGANYPLDPTSNDTQRRGIEPGNTYTYEWKIAKTDQPTAQDAQCITRLYHSAVDIEKDIASGLIGPLLICKSEALNQKGVQKKADGEQQAMFAVFNENKSWYIEDNIKDYCSNPANVKRDDPKFYNSNIMHTINGYVSDSSEILGFCQDSVVQWHFSSVGTHDELVSVRLSGHSFLYQGKHEDVLNLFPMSGESVTVEMDNVGTWLLASWGSPEMSSGMRLRFRDARCDNEEDDMFDVVDFTYTKTDKKAVSTSVEDDVLEEEIDKDDLDYQDYLASFYSIRSLRKATANEENQNLTALAWEQYEGTDAMRSEVAAGSGLTAIYSSESTSTSKFSETRITPFPLIEAETFQSNHTSTSAPRSVHNAENTSEIIGTGQLPNDYDDELEEENKMEKSMQDVNLTFTLDLIVGDESNASNLSEPKLSKDKQADTSLGNISPNSSPALVKNLLESSLPRSGKYSSKMTNEEWNLVSAKGSLGLEANLDKSVGGKLNRHGRNVTAFISKKHMKKFQGFLHLTGENQKGSHMHPTLKGREENKNDTLSASGTFIKIRRKKKEYPKMTHLMSPRSKKSPKITNSMAEFDRTLFLDETNHTTPPCCTNITEAPSEANHTHLSNAKHEESRNYTLTPRQFKPSITIGLPQENGEYEYVMEGYYNEETSGSEYEYHYVTFDDPYMTDPKVNINEQRNPDNIAEHYLRSKGNERRYYIAAKEVCWNYAGYKKRFDGTTYKVIFQSYTDSTFTTIQDEDEYNEHLGILGPVIRAEVDDVILVHFKNLASRPYSLHAHGLFYEKSSEGSIYDDESPAWFKEDDQVQPNNSYIYVWYANRRSGPVQSGAACRSWIYYSDLNMEKDTHSGLIGPILVCQKGTFSNSNNSKTSTRDFFLLFMVFDEEKSWYFDKRSRSPNVTSFSAINGITYNLQGLRMYEGELVRWHLLNMGGPKDIHVVNFHGQTFIEQGKPQHQLGTYMLLPGSFRTIEMKPQRPGWWLLDTEVGEYQQAGMQASYLVIEKECKIPMGLASGVILDSQIDASHHIDYWAPKLARLNNSGTYNAWSTIVKKEELAWIQVDFQRQVLLTGIQTQGAKQFFKSLYVQKFFIVYSKDKRKWSTFKGDSSPIFEGNSDAYGVKENIIDPPIIARYIRVYPTEAYNRPTLRMELLGCEVDGCSLPLGMENREIKNTQITASSVKTSWFSTWDPSLARLNQEGKMNAWRAKLNNNQQWLQIDLLTVKKITAIATQGVKYMSAENFVKTYIILYSDQGSEWKSYMDGSSSVAKVFLGNENSNGHVKHFFNPPILSRFIRIVPRTWYNSIALRVELYGCDFGGDLTVKRTDGSGSS
uniref:Uncharacterized protein n=1 Tax=Melopsittacus undulatus TaxID=13146 RepID=A0A8C6J4Q0_MELUD